MTDNKTDPEVMETLKSVKAANQERESQIKKIEAINEFEREIGIPNTESERFVTESKINITKVDRALKKRGL